MTPRAAMLTRLRTTSRLRGRQATRALMILMLVLTALMVAALVFGSSRSFLVEARTASLTLTFGTASGPDGTPRPAGDEWRLTGALACRPAPLPRRGATDPCGAAYAPQGAPGEHILDWAPGTTIRLRNDADGRLTIEIRAGMAARGYPDGTLLILEPAAQRRLGALTFHAAATLGEDMAAGARFYLTGGRWEAREAGRVTSMFRGGVTEIIKTGDFATGARARILKDGEPAQVSGQVVPAPGGGPMEVTIISEAGDTALGVRHFGVRDEVVIKPDWVDIAVDSPLLLALAAIFSLLAAAKQALVDTTRKDDPGGAG